VAEKVSKGEEKGSQRTEQILIALSRYDTDFMLHQLIGFQLRAPPPRVPPSFFEFRMQRAQFQECRAKDVEKRGGVVWIYQSP
jgi:hypothetical protein